METVYREALAGPPRGMAATAGAAGRPSPARAYRRLGISFMLTAGVLAVSLLVPRAAYPTLFGAQGSGVRLEEGGAAVVRVALDGADSAVRDILREQANGGNTR